MSLGLSNIEVENRLYIEEQGVQVLKVKEVDQSNLTSNGNIVLRVTFINRDQRHISDNFVLTNSALWRVKLLTNALKLEGDPSADDITGRYVTAKIEREQYNSNGIIKSKMVIKNYTPCKLQEVTNIQAKEDIEIVHSSDDSEDSEEVIPF